MGNEFESQDGKPKVHLSAHDDAGSVCDGAKGEYMLLWAMLNRAILDACGTTSENVKSWSGARKAAAVRESARAWIFEDDTEFRPRPFGIFWVCEHLGINPERVRAEVRAHCDDWAFRPVAQAALCNEQMVNLLLKGIRES